MKLSSEDRRELEKYAKHLALKSTQVIVQSRLGEKFVTACYPEPISTSWSWFNLNINDVPEVYAETKRVLSGKVLSTHLPLCVEISLRTTEGDQMVLETWCLGLSPEKCEPSSKIVKKIYKRIQFLLKSLLSITRVVPAYKLSRMQGPDSYVICYRIYMGEPKEQCLGEDYKRVQIDQICTPIGTFHLSVSYRTKLTISPTQTGQNNYIIKTEQVNTNLEAEVETEYDDDESDDSDDENLDFMTPGAFVDPSRIKTLADFQHLILPPVPPGWLPPKKMEIKTPANTEKEKKPEENAEALPEPEKSVKNEDDSDSGSSVDLTVPMCVPFATRTDYTDLGDFMREVKKPEPLEAFTDVSPPDAAEVARQLELFEAVAVEYNELAESLHKSPSESPDSN